MSRPAIIVIVAQIGPYHAARLRAVGDQLGADQVLALEVASRSAEYSWDKVGNQGFRRQTLFDVPYERVGSSAIARRITGALSRIRPRALAINGWGFPEARAALRWSNQVKCPSILMSDSQEHDAHRVWIKERVKQRLIKNADAAFVAGAPHARYLEKLGFDPARIVSGYDVVDNTHFREGALDARRDPGKTRARLGLPSRYFICCARFVKKKGLRVLLDAFARYRRDSGADGCDLVLVGDGPMREELEHKVRVDEVAAAVHFLGFRQYGDLPAYYALAEALVLPSLNDQWGLVVNEAMAAGLPVIVSDACGCAEELVGQGVNGYSVPAGDSVALTKCLSEVAGSGALREEMGRASAERIARWTPESFATSLTRAIDIAAQRTTLSFAMPDAGRAPLPPHARVALVTNMVPPYRRRVFEELNRLTTGNLRVVSLSAIESNRRWKPAIDAGFDTAIIPGRHVLLEGRDWAIHLNWGVTRELERYRPDVVVIGGWDSLASWGALRWARRVGAATVLWSGSHRLSARNSVGLIAWAKRRFVRSCDAFVTYGTLAAEYLAQLGAKPERVVVSANAVDTTSFHPDEGARRRLRAERNVQGKVVVLYAGQLIPRKGVELLIDAVAELADPRVELWMVGSGSMEDAIKDLAVRKLPGAARVFGEREYRAMAQEYAAADLFVMPSLREVWGLVLNEAMSSGLPVVASTLAGATADLVLDGENGLTFDPFEAGSLTRALKRLVENDQQRQEMGRRAREHLLAHGAEEYAADFRRAIGIALASHDGRR